MVHRSAFVARGGFNPKLTAPEGTLIQVLADASSRAAAAHAEFIAAVDNIPSGLPHPDGTQRIQNASSKLRAARDDMKSAHSRLDTFMITGIVPED